MRRFTAVLFAWMLGVQPALAQALDAGSSVSLRPGGRYVVVDTDVNEVRLMDGDEVLWAAPAGTGTGLRLRDKAGDWDFGTPNGIFQVQFKELNPVWIAADWYFVENKLPIPPQDSPSRRQPGGLGAAAVYLGHDLAIHGTDKPELLGQRVSHGCIRLSDEYAIRLFHDVQIGTPVVITGNPPEPDPVDPGATAARPGTKKKEIKLRNVMGEGPTATMLDRLDAQIDANPRRGWTETASHLIARAVDGDSEAAEGLLLRVGFSADDRFEREYAAFLADAYSRGPRQMAAALGAVSRADRARAAAAIVDAMMDLYHGRDLQRAPWPTTRLPQLLAIGDARRGWNALQDAEDAFRSQYALRSAPALLGTVVEPSDR